MAILIVAPILFLWTRLFLDVRLIPSFAVTSVMAACSALLVTSLSFAVERADQDATILGDVKKFLTGKSGSLDARIATGMVFCLVLISGNFGYHRAMALAISKPVCISTRDEEILVAIIGQTSFGFVVAKVEEGNFRPFNFPIGVATLSSAAFSFISAQQDLRISTNCSSLKPSIDKAP